MSAETIAELSVRAARAEIERDQWRQKYEQLSRSFMAWHRKDKDELLDTLHIIGIPARDLADIYKIEQEWVRAGASQNTLETWRELWALRAALQEVVVYPENARQIAEAALADLAVGESAPEDESEVSRGGCGGVQDG